MIDDWEKEIAKALDVQIENERLDTEHLWDYHPPNAAATEEELTLAHWRLGFPIDPNYKRFLSHANGWRCFYQMVDLFGTEELMGGPLMQRMLDLLDDIDLESLAKENISKSDLIPIGHSTEQSDDILLLKPGSVAPGMVLWFGSGAEVERYPNFDEFFLAMVDLNRDRFQDQEKEQLNQIEPADAADGGYLAQAERQELPTKAGGGWRSLLSSLFRKNRS